MVAQREASTQDDGGTGDALELARGYLQSPAQKAREAAARRGARREETQARHEREQKGEGRKEAAPPPKVSGTVSSRFEALVEGLGSDALIDLGIELNAALDRASRTESEASTREWQGKVAADKAAEAEGDGIYIPVGFRKQMFRADGHDLLALDRHRGVHHLRGGNNLAAPYDRINMCINCHFVPPASCLPLGDCECNLG